MYSFIVTVRVMYIHVSKLDQICSNNRLSPVRRGPLSQTILLHCHWIRKKELQSILQSYTMIFIHLIAFEYAPSPMCPLISLRAWVAANSQMVSSRTIWQRWNHPRYTESWDLQPDHKSPRPTDEYFQPLTISRDDSKLFHLCGVFRVIGVDSQGFDETLIYI